MEVQPVNKSKLKKVPSGLPDLNQTASSISSQESLPVHPSSSYSDPVEAPKTVKDVEVKPLNVSQQMAASSSAHSTSDTEYAKFKRNQPFKRNILKRLRQIGPDPDNFDEITKNNLGKLNPKDISGFLIDFQRKCQLAADLQFPNLAKYNEICKMVSESQELCKNEIPVALDAIVHLEAQPSPNESDLVKFIHLYKLLSDVAKGHPVDELDDINKLILTEAHAELMAAIGSTQGQKDLKKLEKLFSERIYEASADSELIQELRHIMADSTFNLFGLPAEFLVRLPTNIKANTTK